MGGGFKTQTPKNGEEGGSRGRGAVPCPRPHPHVNMSPVNSLSMQQESDRRHIKRNIYAGMYLWWFTSLVLTRMPGESYC